MGLEGQQTKYGGIKGAANTIGGIKEQQTK
jgi:hypothetical protein